MDECIKKKTERCLFLVGYLSLLFFLFAPLFPVQALTQQQADSVLELLRSFGAEPEVLSRVDRALRGTVGEEGGDLTTERFSRDLSIGSRGEDVRELQRWLNTQGFTVASQGPGSPGQETGFFGEMTRAALARFQFENAIEPARGFFGPATRAVVNSYAALGHSSESKQTELPDGGFEHQQEEAFDIPFDADPRPGEDPLHTEEALLPNVGQNASERPSIAHPFVYDGYPGASFPLSGMNFASDGNTVIFEGERTYSIENLSSSSSGRLISVPVPDIPPGKYDLRVRHSGGMSDRRDSAFFYVTDEALSRPSVDSISPGTITSPSDTITVRGSGFLSEKNEVRGTAGTLSDLSSSDGTTLSFSLSDFEFFEEVTKGLAEAGGEGSEDGWRFVFRIVVANAGGVSDLADPVTIDLSGTRR